MNLSHITPVVLTWNEEPNLRRCLDGLRWAERVVVVDSGSTDATLAICEEYTNVEVLTRTFDSFAGQCNFALDLIRSEWVLSLDADYIVPTTFPGLVAELDGSANGYRFPFRYCVYGKPLRACLYPPRTVLYRRRSARYVDDGHAHRVQIDGTVEDVTTPIDHDDRKPLTRWFDSQRKYAALEAEKLLSEDAPTGMADRLRRMIWPAAPAAFVYTLLAKGIILDGWPGWFYALQRTCAEVMLSLVLLEKRIGKNG